MRRFELLEKDRVGLSFPYNEQAIARIKQIPGRKWNAQEKRWEIPLSHLQEALQALGADPTNLPRPLLEAYQAQWGQDIDARLESGNCFTELSGKKIPIDEIDEVTSFWMEGAEHTDRYKKGQWDGRKRLLKQRKTIEFPTGLLSRVQEVLDRRKIRYEIIQTAPAPKPSLKLTLHDIQLRDYQKESVKAAIKEGRGVLQMATGAGKTVVAAAIIAKLGQPALFFVHTKDLLYQAKNYFKRILDVPIGQIGDGIVEIQPITVATIQTTSRAFGMKIPKEELSEIEEDATPVTAREQIAAIVNKCQSTPLVFFDECHHLPASTCYAIAMKTEAAFYRFGLSATPYRSDRQDLMIEAAAGHKIFKVDSSFLIQKGYLVRPRIFFIPIASTLPRKRFIRYPTVYTQEVVENPKRNQIIAEFARKYGEQGRSVLVLVTQVKHGKILNGLLPDAILLTGQDTSDMRNRTLDALRDKTQNVVIATTLADEGLDIPGLEVLILAGAGKSETRALQRIGRALRKTPTKHEALVIDFYDQANYLEVHSRKRFEIYQTENEFNLTMEDTFDPASGSLRGYAESLFSQIRK